MLAFRLVEHSTHDAVVHVYDLIGDSRLGIEQYLEVERTGKLLAPLASLCLSGCFSSSPLMAHILCAVVDDEPILGPLLKQPDKHKLARKW